MKARGAFAAMFGNQKYLAVVAAITVAAIAFVAGVGPAAAVAPLVTVENADNVEYTTADVSGTVNPEGQSTSWRFQYATAADFSNAQDGPSGSTETAEPVSGQLTNLKPGTTYHLRLLAENADGQGEAVAGSTFATKPVTKPEPGQPQVLSNVGHTAHFEATVDPNAPEANSLLSQAAKDAYATHWWFTCQPSCSFSGLAEGDVPADDTPVTVEADAEGLLGNTAYVVTLHVRNAGGEETSQASFNTSVIPPEVDRNILNGVEPGFDSFTALGSVNPNGSEITDCHFVYGIGSAAGNMAPCSPRKPTSNEQQEVKVWATSGQFRLVFESETTPDLSFNATPAQVQAALEGLDAIGPGNVSVEGGPGTIPGDTPYVITFVGNLAGEDQPQIGSENGTVPLGNSFLVKTIADGRTQLLMAYPVSGQFRLSLRSELTTTLSIGASGGEVQAALEALPSVGSSVSVNTFPLGAEGIQYAVDFPGSTPTIVAEPVGLLAGATKSSTRVNGNITSIVPVSAELPGLSPETDYRYKLVASNDAGTVEGPEVSFRTLSTPAGEVCANASVRAEQASASGECRAFEMVSPQDKNGANVTAEDTNIFAAADGNGAVFLSRGGFAGSTGSGRTGFTQYLSRRGPAGWGTKAITPTPSPGAIQGFAGGTDLFYFSDDLTKAVLWGYDMPGQGDDVANNDNLYRLDTGSGALETVTLATQWNGAVGFSDFEGNARVWGASRDTGVVSFGSTTRLLPNAIQGKRNAYEWDHGVLRLAGILPNGEVAPGGSTPAHEGEGYREAVSSDGSRVIFEAPLAESGEGPTQLYMRRNHSDTVWISEPEYGSPGDPANVYLDWVSPDAKKIIFTTTTPLLEDDTNSSADVYMYTDGPHPESEENLTLISSSGQVRSSTDQHGAVLGASDDGKRVYFLGADSGEIRLFENGEVRRVALGYVENQELNGPMSSPGPSRISADGRFLVFRGNTAITGRKIRKPLPTSEVAQLYVYDAERQTIACASCQRDGETVAAVPYQPAANEGGIRKNIKGLRPRFLSTDGKVFFSTAEPLVPADTNGVVDTYVYDSQTGKQALVSSGKGEYGQWFVNASASGRDVFIATSQALVGADRDTLTDLYDARVGGGFAEPPPPPTACVGENCRNAVSGAPAGSSPATERFVGPGNRRCEATGKGKKRNSKKNTKKCHSKPKKHPPKKHRKKGSRAKHSRSAGKNTGRGHR